MAPSREAPRSPAADPERESLVRRITYLMLLRVVVTSLLLIAALGADVAEALSLVAPGFFIFSLIAITYGLTVVWALLLRRVRSLRRLAAAQIACDIATTTLLVHTEGGAESGFVLLYLLVIIGAALVLHRRGTTLLTAAIAFAYVAISIVDRQGLLPPWDATTATMLPVRTLVFTLAKNLVLFAATAALALRLGDELERAGERIAAQGERLEDLATLHADVVRSVTSGLLTLADDGVVRTVNPAGEEILGVPAASLIGRPIGERLPELASYLSARAADATAPKGRIELVVERPDGGRQALGFTISTLWNGAGGGIGRVVSFQDLTELRDAQAQAERAERLAAIGRLSAGIAHEIRNPLAAISGSVQLLRAFTPEGGDSGDLMEIVTREADRLNRLLTDLLDFANPRPAERSPVELGSLLGEIARMAEHDKRLAPLPGRIRVDVREPVWVEADPGQLRQVVLNLLLNAADATPGDQAIDLSAARDGDEATIAVRDRGPGIPPELRARIFEPFFSTKKGGTGLGLATVHRIVETHGGHLAIEDADGGGARIAIVLPAIDPPPPAPGHDQNCEPTITSGS